MIDTIIKVYVTIIFRILSFLTLVATIPVIFVRELYMRMIMSEYEFVQWDENFRHSIRENVTGKGGVI